MNHYSYMRSCERYDDDEVDPCLAANVRLRKQYCFGLSRLKFYLCLVASLLLIILLSLLLLFFLYRDYVPLFAGAKDFTTAGNESTTPTTTSPPTRASTSPSIASQTHSPSTAVKIEASSRAPTEPTSLPPSVVVKVEESTEATTPTPTEATTPSPTEATTPPPTEATTPPPTEATTPPPTKATTPSPTKATTPPSTKATSPPTSSAPVRIKPTTSSPFPETTTAASIKKSTSSGDHWLGLERVHAAAKKGLLRLRDNNNMRFTTIDADNDAFDKKNCARWHERGAWWHKECTKISLNGKYIESDGRFRGLAWHYENSKNASMYYNIKPKNSLMMYQYI
uniref:Fibrinogen C-terminal domain-containing protein n=1 Tax=Ditylenchus dipsaci TaxID=166011 RepID=A0A915E0R9_9BILA